MLDDILNTRKLAEMIGAARFNTPEEFKTFLSPKLLDELFIDDNRLKDEAKAESARHDFLVMDSLTKLEPIVVIGLKTVAQTPQITAQDIEKFHEDVKKTGAPYGLLITETESHFFAYKTKKEKGKETVEISEIEELDPLNYIDAEFGDKMTPQKAKDLVKAHKAIAIVVGVLIILVLAAELAQSSLCKSSGPIKAEIKTNGDMVYFAPDQSGYDQRTTGDVPGERRYCEEQDAVDDGWTKAQ